MDNLVDRDFALKTYQDVCQGVACCYDCKARDDFGACLLEQWIRGLPSAEPEIIRCKDCKHYRDGHPGTDCCWDFEYNERRQTPDSYCSGAERRTEE